MSPNSSISARYDPAVLHSEQHLFSSRKKGKLRVVVDYRGFNRITNPNHAPITRTDETFDRRVRVTIFSKLYLKAVFHQIRVREEDIDKTEFKTQYGHFNSSSCSWDSVMRWPHFNPS